MIFHGYVSLPEGNTDLPWLIFSTFASVKFRCRVFVQDDIWPPTRYPAALREVAGCALGTIPLCALHIYIYTVLYNVELFGSLKDFSCSSLSS